MYRLVYNNARLMSSSLPWPYWPAAIADMLQRYHLVAKKENALKGYRQARRALPLALGRGLLERHPLSRTQFGTLALCDQLSDLAARLQRENLTHVTLCGTGRFPRVWLHILRQHGLHPHAFLDCNPCWINQQIQTIPVHANPHPDDQHPADAFIIGLSSFSENAYWEEQLQPLPNLPRLRQNSASSRQNCSHSPTPNLLNYCTVYAKTTTNTLYKPIH